MATYTYTCLNCDARHTEDVLGPCGVCGEQVCPQCSHDHPGQYTDEDFFPEDEHVGQLGWGQ